MPDCEGKSDVLTVHISQCKSYNTLLIWGKTRKGIKDNVKQSSREVKWKGRSSQVVFSILHWIAYFNFSPSLPKGFCRYLSGRKIDIFHWRREKKKSDFSNISFPPQKRDILKYSIQNHQVHSVQWLITGSDRSCIKLQNKTKQTIHQTLFQFG